MESFFVSISYSLADFDGQFSKRRINSKTIENDLFSLAIKSMTLLKDSGK